jgi:hypothetical protein
MNRILIASWTSGLFELGGSIHQYFAGRSVGAIARSRSGRILGIDCDVHEVAAHPQRSDGAIAAAAAGLCVSSDGGKSWRVETAGLHATYCSAARYGGDTIFVAASEHHSTNRSTAEKAGRCAATESNHRVLSSCSSRPLATMGAADSNRNSSSRC